LGSNEGWNIHGDTSYVEDANEQKKRIEARQEEEWKKKAFSCYCLPDSAPLSFAAMVLRPVLKGAE
tara:strand:+ start:331 stop:528 length:198 start_codon:yes stop_codon:yes gene_type:complete